jgi:hypothetical protein
LRIPPQAVPTLRNFASLTDDQASELLAALADLLPAVAPSTLSVRLDTSLPHLSKKESEELVTVLFNLWAISASHNWDLRDVAETAAKYDEIGVPEEARPKFTERLYSALSAPSIAAAANAADVATEYDALFHIARCFTDIRPVFSRDPDSSISGAIIVHTLKIDYFTGNDSKSLTLTLSDEDLDDLANILMSAKEKGAKAGEFLKASGLRLFEFSDNLGGNHGSDE